MSQFPTSHVASFCKTLPFPTEYGIPRVALWVVQRATEMMKRKNFCLYFDENNFHLWCKRFRWYHKISSDVGAQFLKKVQKLKRCHNSVGNSSVFTINANLSRFLRNWLFCYKFLNAFEESAAVSRSWFVSHLWKLHCFRDTGVAPNKKDKKIKLDK